jgi:hypothetical protein
MMTQVSYGAKNLYWRLLVPHEKVYSIETDVLRCSGMSLILTGRCQYSGGKFFLKFQCERWRQKGPQNVPSHLPKHSVASQNSVISKEASHSLHGVSYHTVAWSSIIKNAGIAACDDINRIKVASKFILLELLA